MVVGEVGVLVGEGGGVRGAGGLLFEEFGERGGGCVGVRVGVLGEEGAAFLFGEDVEECDGLVWVGGGGVE